MKCRLRVLFAEREIKHGDFANLVGVSQTTLSAWVNNRALPSLEFAFKVAELLGVPVEQVWIRDKNE